MDTDAPDPIDEQRRRAHAEVAELEARLAEAREQAAAVLGQDAWQPGREEAADFVRALPLIAWVKDGGGRHRLTNPAMDSSFGVEEGGTLGRRDEELGLPLAELAELRRHDAEVRASGRPFSGVERVSLPDGERRAWYVSKFPLPDRPGRPPLWGGLAAELTDAFAHEEQLELALDAGGGGTWIWERDGDAETLRFSERCWRMLGLDPKEDPCTPQSWRERMHPEDLPGFVSHLNRVLAGEEGRLDRTLRLRHTDGGWRWVQTVGRAIRNNAAGRPVRMVGLHLDVDRLKTAEAALAAHNRRLADKVDEGVARLEESEERFVSLARDSPLMLWLTHAEDPVAGGDGLWLNPELRSFLGGPGSPGGGRRVLADWVAGLERSEGSGSGAGTEVSMFDADGRERWVLLHGRPRHTRTGGFLGHVGTLLDVTEQHEARAALERSKAELEAEVARQTAELRDRVEELAERNAELDHFAHVASHDLRSPLRTITGFAGFLEPLVASDPEASDFVRRILRAGDRMVTLLDSLLVFASVGRGEVGGASVQLGDVVAEALEDLGVEVERRSAEVEVGPLPVVRGNATMLRQAFQNLLGNALKYAGASSPRVRVSSEPMGPGRCRVTVADAGIGFAPEAAERLFEPFRRFHQEEAPGSGVGLSIVERVVRRHGGRVSAEIAAGEPLSTRFHVELPREEGS